MFPEPSEDEEADRDLREGLRNVSPRTLRTFVLVAALVQVGLFAASLGALLVAFRGQWAIGGALVGGGLLAIALSFARFRRYRDRQRD